MRTLVTGIAGQDGSYLAEQLIEAGAEVVGLVHPREEAPAYLAGLQEVGNLSLQPCDLADPAEIRHVLKLVQPQAIYHFAAVSEPPRCEADPEHSHKVNVVSCQVLVEWLRREQPAARLLLVSSAAVFGNSAAAPQSEATPAAPESEYGRQKQAVRELAKQARTDGLFVACAIPFNHESVRRSEAFVFSKVCRGAARIALRGSGRIELGPLAPRRDWGYAPEYVEAMRWMLEVERPHELVLGTGKSFSIEELARAACQVAQIDFDSCVKSSAELAGVHPAGILDSRADPAAAWRELGWEARTGFHQLVELLTRAALDEYAPDGAGLTST